MRTYGNCAESYQLQNRTIDHVLVVQSIRRPRDPDKAIAFHYISARFNALRRFI